MSIAKLSMQNSVLANMFMIAVFLFGIFAMQMIPREEFPAIDFGSIMIMVIYPGVSPAEIEQLVVTKIEEQIGDVEGIDYIESTADEGRAIIRVQFDANVKPDKAWADLNTEMDKVSGLPVDSQKPILLRLNMREVNPICQVVIGGEFSGNTARDIAENMKQDLTGNPAISKIDIYGTRDRQIWIDADQYKLDEYGITLNDLMAAVQSRNMNIPAGSLRFNKAEFLIRTVGEFTNTEQIASMVIKSDANGRFVRLGDIAAIRDTLKKSETISRLDGKTSVSIFLYKKAEGNIIKVMKEVRAYVAQEQKNVPGLSASIQNDGSIEVKNSLKSLGSNGVQGIILVFIALFIFLGWRNASLASLGIPFSIFVTFIYIYFTNYTLNNLSIFGLIITVGMVVDNNIVVIENTHRLRESGMGLKEAIIAGTDQVVWPVAASTLTTLAAFLPLLMMEGVLGKFLAVLPVVVAVSLFASLYQSLLILPNNLMQFSRGLNIKDRTAALQKKFSVRYEKVLTWILKHRILAVGSIMVMFILSFVAIGLGLIKLEFFPQQIPQTILLQLKTPLGTSLNETDKIVMQVEDFIQKMKTKPDIKSVVSNTGVMSNGYNQDIQTSNAQVTMDLVDVDAMKYSHDDIKKELRGFLDRLPGLYSYKFAQIQAGAPVGNDVELRVKGDNLNKLASIGNIVKAELQKIPGVVDIEDSFQPGKKEVRIIPDLDKIALYGLSVAQIASTIRTASSGSKSTTYRGDGVKEYDIIVKLEDQYTNDFENLKNLKIATRSGDLIAIGDLAQFEITGGLSAITHRDRKRIITITAAVSNYQQNGRTMKRRPPEVIQALTGNKIKGQTGSLENFNKKFPGYTLEFGGVQEQQSRSYNSLYRAFILALLLIYIILAAQFKSYVQPLIVMTTVPFAFIGVILGLLVTGLPFSLNTLISVVALAGVVVNNSLLLVDFINHERENGADRWTSIIKAGSTRLRPILLTTVTTIIGMLPIVFSTAKATQAWRPLAVCFTFGLAFATILTLFIIPCIYSLVDSISARLHIARFKESM